MYNKKMKDFRCVECDSLFDDAEIGSMLFCPLCDGHLEAGKFQKPEKTKNYNDHDKQTKSEYRRQEDNYFIFSCLFCDKSLRVAFPFKSLRFRCSNCSSKYDIHSTKSNSGVYLVVPKLDRNSSYNTPPKKPTIPEEVKKALHLFDLNENASLADLKIAYRKCMAEYHPDKVSHLGADLRKLAEEKTREYNTAFDVIKKYFDQ